MAGRFDSGVRPGWPARSLGSLPEEPGVPRRSGGRSRKSHPAGAAVLRSGAGRIRRSGVSGSCPVLWRGGPDYREGARERERECWAWVIPDRTCCTNRGATRRRCESGAVQEADFGSPAGLRPAVQAVSAVGSGRGAVSTVSWRSMPTGGRRSKPYGPPPLLSRTRRRERPLPGGVAPWAVRCTARAGLSRAYKPYTLVARVRGAV